MSRCPICNRPKDETTRPFCSRRCADKDLAKWFSGSYAIPSEESEGQDEAVPNAQEEGEKPH